MILTIEYKTVQPLYQFGLHRTFIQIISTLLLALGCNNSHAQCSFSAAIQTPVSTCLGVTLNVSSDKTVSKILWERESVIVQTETANVIYNPHGITMAGEILSGPDLSHFNAPNGIFVDAASNFYVSDYNNQRVTKWLPGATSGIVVAGGNGLGSAANQLYGANGVWVTANGDVYVVDINNHRIQKWPPGATTGITVAGGNGPGLAANQLNFPTAIFMDASNSMYISDSENSRVQKWVSGATSGITVAGGNGYGSAANQLSGPTGLYVDGSLNIYVCDASNGRIQEWSPGALAGVTVAGGNGTTGLLGVPYGIWMEANGSLLVSDLSGNTIQEWVPGAATGKIIAGLGYTNDTDLGLSDPSAICLDASGNLWVADELNYRIQKFLLTSTIDLTYTPSAPGRYTAEITDPSGCTTTSNTIIISPYVTPSITISTPDISICGSSTAVFSAFPLNGGDQPVFQWQVNGINEGNNSSEFTDPNIVTGDLVRCIMTGNAVCSTTPDAISENIVMKVLPGSTTVVTISVESDTLCSNEPITLSANLLPEETGVVYQWMVNGMVEGNNNSVFTSSQFNNGDIVNCRISDATGSACAEVLSNSLILAIQSSPLVTSSEVSVKAGQSIVLDPIITGDVSTYIWSYDPGLSALNIKNPTATTTINTSYKLKVISPAGCAAEGQISVNIYSPIRIPNAFTPNNDGKNDVFFVMGDCENCTVKSFEVFNRWGQKIFEATNVKLNDPNNGWKGNTNGIKDPAGTYVYFITIDRDGNNEIHKGTVLLIR